MLIITNQTLVRLFTCAHVTFVLLAIPLLTTETCNDHSISSESSLGLQYISTRLLYAKFSDRLYCVLLPVMLMINVTVLVIQHHFTIVVLRECDYLLIDVLCYIAVLGWIVVLLFDSQPVSGHLHQGHIHIVGVAMIALGDAMLHAFVIMSIHIERLVQPRNGYVALQVAYTMCLTVFMILFAMHEPGAIQIEYAVLFMFLLLSCTNLYVLHYYVENPFSCAVSDIPDPRERRYIESAIGPMVVFLLITLVFMSQYAYGFDATF